MPWGENLSSLVHEIFGPEVAGLDVLVGAAVDEVTLTVKPEDVPAVCSICKNDLRLKFDYLRCLSVVDYVESSGEFEVNYHIYSLDIRHKMVVKTRLPEDAPGCSDGHRCMGEALTGMSERATTCSE